MNPSYSKFSSIVPKCLKSEDPEAEIFLRNHDLIPAIENFMSQRTEFWKYDDILKNMFVLIQNLVVSLEASEKWKEATFWQSQIVRLSDHSAKLYRLYVYRSIHPESSKCAEYEAVASKMVAGLDCEVFEKVKGDVNVDEYRDKTKETDDIVSLTDVESKLDKKLNVNEALVKKEDYEGVEKVIPKEIEDIRLLKYDDKLDDPLNNENLATKKDYEVVEIVKDDLDNVQLSEIKENDDTCDKLKEAEEVCLIKYEDKLNEIPDNEFKDEESLVIPQEISPMDSASSGIFFPEGCGSVAEGKHDPNKVPVEVDGNSNNKGVEDATDNVEESDAKSTITKVIGELVNIKPDQSEVVVEEQVCCCYDEDDGSLQVFEEGNDENPKVEEGYDDGNAQEVPINNENVLFGDSKVSTTVEIFSNGSPASKLLPQKDLNVRPACEIKVKHEPDDWRLNLFDECIAKNTNVEVGGDDINAHKDVINNDNEPLGVSKVTSVGVNSSNDTHASKLLAQNNLNVRPTSNMELEHDLNEISEALARESVNNEDKVKPDMENIEGKEDLLPDSNTKEAFNDNNSNFNENSRNEFVRASVSSMEQEESVVESVITIANAEFETKKHIWSNTSGKSEKELVSYDVEDILSEDQVEDGTHDNNATKDDDEDYLEVYDNNLGASFMELVSKNTNVAKEELHDYDETSGKESDDEFNIVVKEDKVLVSQETSDEGLAKDNEAVLENFKETTIRENDDQGSLDKENDDQRSLIEDDDQKGSIDEADDQSNTEDEEVLDKDEEHVGVHYDLTECDVVELHDETLEVMYEDINDSLEVSEDNEDECDDAQAGKLSACAEKSFHNVATQTSEEMPDNYEESTAKETDDKFGTEVNKEMLNYDEISKVEVYDKLPNEVSETFMNEVLNDGLEVFEDDAVSKHLNPDKNADAALEDDEGQSEKPVVIKMLFKGTFSENAMEILENLNKFKKINFGNRDANGLDAHFSSPENPSYTLAEEIADKDSETESFQVSEAIKNQTELRHNDLNVKTKEVKSDEDVIENVVDNDQKVDAENTVLKTKTVNQMVFPMLADWFVTSLIAKVAVNILMCMRQFVVLSHLLALSNMLMEINTDLMEKVAQMVKMNGCCCASPSLLTGGETKDGGPYHAEETVTVYRSPTTMDNLNNLLAVNMDYTEMEEEPNYLASVDNPIMSIKSSRARDTALVSRGPFTRLDI